MREHKLRYWDEIGKRFLYVNLRNSDDLYNMYHSDLWDGSTGRKKIIHFCTGYKDKSGKDIYEGDYLSSSLSIEEDEKLTVIYSPGYDYMIHNESGYSVKMYECSFPNKYEVIGNKLEGVKPIKKNVKVDAPIVTSQMISDIHYRIDLMVKDFAEFRKRIGISLELLTSEDKVLDGTICSLNRRLKEQYRELDEKIKSVEAQI